MEALAIKFKEKPDLENILGNLSAWRKSSAISWDWASGCGNIHLLIFEHSNILDISATNTAPMTQKRINGFVNRIKKYYPECEIKYNREFYMY